MGYACTCLSAEHHVHNDILVFGGMNARKVSSHVGLSTVTLSVIKLHHARLMCRPLCCMCVHVQYTIVSACINTYICCWTRQPGQTSPSCGAYTMLCAQPSRDPHMSTVVAGVQQLTSCREAMMQAVSTGGLLSWQRR